MAQRISRAKQSIKASGVPFTVPTPEERAARLVAVMHVLYLIFSEGYTASSGPEVHRSDLSSEALRLTRMLHRLVPDDCEVAGLLALMLLTDARRAARTGPAGELVPLDEQDRAAWDREAIAEGVALLTATLPRGAVGAYQLQAAIAAVHDEAENTASTDWTEILGLYGLLQRISDKAIITLNHRDRDRDGSRPRGGARAPPRRARRGPAARRPPSPACGSRPSPRTSRRPRRRDRPLRTRRGARHERRRAKLPFDPSGPPARVRNRRGRGVRRVGEPQRRGGAPVG